MKLQKKLIQFTASISVLLVICTYLVTLNIELGFISISSPLISNNFVLMVFGGAFASMFVVLICELQKYFELKKKTQDDIFRHTARAYIQLILLKSQIQQGLSNPDELIPKGILDTPTTFLKEELSVIASIEYKTYSGKCNSETSFITFCNTTARNLSSFTIYINYLTIAINTDKINNLSVGIEDGITSASPNTNRALKKLQILLEPLISQTDAFLQLFDEQCGKRFNWDIRKNTMQIGCQNPEFISFDDFIED